MAHSVVSRASGPANELRDGLDEVERILPGINGDNVEELLVLLDRLDLLFTQLEPTGIDLRSEQGRWGGLLDRLSRSAHEVAVAARRAGGFDRLRRHHPPAESFWWHLDREAQRRRLAALRRTLLRVGATVGTLFLVVWVVQTFFPPDPRSVLLSQVTHNLDQLLQQADWPAAMALIEDAQRQASNEPELLIWEGVISERMGDEVRAARSLGEARALAADQPVYYWISVGNRRLQVGDFDGAAVAAEEALALDDQEGQAYFLLATVAEARGDLLTAIDLYQRTFDVAQDSSPQVAVMSRVRLGQLLQQSGSFMPTVEPVVTPTP